MALLTADWSIFGKDKNEKDEYFRRFDVYDMEWMGEINFKDFTLTCTRFGGPIAAVRDKNKFVKIQGGGRPVITIYTTSGQFISSFVWSSGQIVQLGWSSVSDLLCIQEDAKVIVYDLYGVRQHHFSMGQEAEDTKVLEAQVFPTQNGTGVAVLTKAHRIFFVNTVRERESRVRIFAEPKDSIGAPSAWLVFCPERQCRCFFARGKLLYHLVDNDQPSLKSLNFPDEVYKITRLAISPDYSYLGVFTDRGKIWLGSADTFRVLRVYDCHMNLGSPLQMMWCGSDGVVLNLDSSIEVIGCNEEENLLYQYDVPFYLVPEIDCVRVITSTQQEIIQRVPHVVRDIFRINSTSPASYLLEASKQYSRKSHQANEYLHLVKPSMKDAVENCIKAAGHEFNPDVQEMLMKAAQLGKIFLDKHPDEYVDMIKILPCLNAVRDKKIGIPLTYGQYEKLGIDGLMNLLISRRHYYVALKIANFLKAPYSVKILSQWACYKVKQDLSKEQIAREISEKLKGYKGISYTEIAKKASEAGKTELAIKLIEYEPCASLQVPLLMDLKDNWTALQKAIDSGNTDLVYVVLHHLKNKLSVGEFQMKIREYPLAYNLYVNFCREGNVEVLKDVLVQEDDNSSLAECFIKEYFDPKNRSMREASLAASSENFKKCKSDVYHSLCEEQLKLLKYQKQLEEKYRRDFIGKSVHDTLRMLLSLNEVKLAEKLRSEYKVPDRRYWWLRVEVLGELRDWNGLETLSKSKKSPIGYEPFVDICLDNSRIGEAKKYFPKVKDELKVKYLVRMGMLEEAADTAFQQNDYEALVYVQSKCSESNLVAKVQSMVQELGRKRK